MKHLVKPIALCILCIPFFLHIIVFFCIGGGKFKEDFINYKSKRNLKYNNILSFVSLLFIFPEFRSVFYWRLGKWARYFFWYLPGRTNLELFTPSSRVGGGFYIGHGWGTVVNAESIGRNFIAGQCCTIGSRNGKLPILGDNVGCWAHSVVLGDINIGDNCQIGSGSVVVKSLPSNSVVVPSKSQIIKLNGERVNIPL